MAFFSSASGVGRCEILAPVTWFLALTHLDTSFFLELVCPHRIVLGFACFYTFLRNVYGFFYAFLRIFTDFYAFLRIFTDFYACLRSFTRFHACVGDVVQV